MAAKTKAAPVVEYFGFLENGSQTQDSYRPTQKALANEIVVAGIQDVALNTAIPTPSGMTLEFIEKRLFLRLVDD